MRVFILTKRTLIIILCIVVLLAGVLSFFGFKDKLIETISPSKVLPIYCVDTDEKKIAISFDAAWGDSYTKGILDILDEYNVKTTFFLVGFWVDRYPHLVKEMKDRGHEVQNHSSTHPHMSKLSKEQIANELNKTGKKIYDITGVRPSLFRPPFGDYNNTLINTAKDCGYYTIQWSVDSLDWKELGVEPVVDRVTRNIKNGSIVLFHNNAKYVLQYLPRVLKKVQEDGYTVVPISQLIIKENYEIDHTGKQIRMKTD